MSVEAGLPAGPLARIRIMGEHRRAVWAAGAALEAAIGREWVRRQDRDAHPDGSFDNGGRWYPSAAERASCCSDVRGPSRAWPYSLMQHCRSRPHLRTLARESPEGFAAVAGCTPPPGAFLDPEASGPAVAEAELSAAAVAEGLDLS